MRLRTKLANVATLVFPLFLQTALLAQLSSTAYRVLGQADFHQNGPNRVQGTELNGPLAVGLDTRDGVSRIYISDTRNHRVLAWPDAHSYQIGAPPALVLGQPSLLQSAPLGIGASGLLLPVGLAVHPASGDLYVADTGNHRVLRFPNPFANLSRVEPNAVYGQPNLTTRTANTSGVSQSSLNSPRALAFDAGGNLWIADTGNHRVLRYPASQLDSVSPSADLVLGQKDFVSNRPNQSANGVTGAGFDTPSGMAFDSAGHFFIADFNNARVLRFDLPLQSGATAVTAFGQAALTTRSVPASPTASSLAGPTAVSVDSKENLYVVVPADNRVLVFDALGKSGIAAADVFGQRSPTANLPNAAARQPAANTLASPYDVKVDASGAVVIADSSNNRVLLFPATSRDASLVWGQVDFAGNGINQIKPASLYTPYKMAVDYKEAPFPLYLSDTGNHRILVWRDSARFRSGSAADLVIGQQDLHSGLPNFNSRDALVPTRESLSQPRGIAVDLQGNLWVADAGNHRVLRYPRPVLQSGQIVPDLVLGQPDFTTASSASVSASSLRSPASVAFGPDGSLFVADSGNNRVLEFPANLVAVSAAIRVFGQSDFGSSSAPSTLSAQTLSSPGGLVIDASFHLYVADSGANRIVVFPATGDAPPSGAVASIVIGQDRFDTGGAGSGANRLKLPTDLGLDSAMNLYVSDSGNNRVVVFPSLVSLPVTGAAAASVVGQRTLAAAGVNSGSTDGLATSEGISTPIGLLIDRRDTLYVADAGNSRVVHFLKILVPVQAAQMQLSVPLARGGLATVYGSGLSSRSEAASAIPFSTALADRKLVVNDGKAAPLLYASPGQVNFQLPSDAPLGTTRIALLVSDTEELIAGANPLVAATLPGLFTATQDGKGQALIVNQDGTINGPKNAAPRGSFVQFYGTGAGDVTPSVEDGTGAPSSPLAYTVATPTSDGGACVTRAQSVCLAIGSTFGDIQFSGLAPGLVGVWQLNVKIPDGALTGPAIPVRAVVNGSLSNLVTMAIK